MVAIFAADRVVDGCSRVEHQQIVIASPARRAVSTTPSGVWNMVHERVGAVETRYWVLRLHAHPRPGI